MSRNIFIVLLLLGLQTGLTAQTSYLNNSYYLGLTDSCLRLTYSCSFEKARSFQHKLDELTPGHPVPPFLEALILYWEEFPLLPDNVLSKDFDALLDESVARSAPLLEHSHTQLEGIFFDLFGRAFKAMFWADNGKSAKAATNLRHMYKRTKEGFLLTEDLSEFLFSTGLYNYYIEAFPEAHPIYKPLVSFMHEGDREKGLKQLNRAIHETVFLRVEATQFMALIQLNYENDLNTAALYAERLHREFPDNLYYGGLVTCVWLHQGRFEQARGVQKQISTRNDPYSLMIGTLIQGFLAEKESGNEKQAGKAYQKLVSQAEALGTIANMFAAMGNMGLSRLYEARGLHGTARRYARRAEALTAYAFILDEGRMTDE